MRAALLTLLLVGCGPWPDIPAGECLSMCGSKLHHSGDCEGLQAAELALVAAVDKHRPNALWVPAYTCAALSGLHVIVRRAGVGAKGPGSWMYGDMEIAGLTYCATREIVIGSDDWHANAYGHEVLHVLEGCVSSGADHSHWNKRHWSAIGDARLPPK